MNTFALSFIAVCAACLLAVPVTLKRIDRWRRDKTDDVHRWLEDENMPLVLRNAVVVMNEQSISMTAPVQVSGRVDQVYQTPAGVLILVDTKTRRYHSVYTSDIVQLSLYAMILLHTGSSPVSRTGYVRTVVRDNVRRSVRYHSVRLIAKDLLIQNLK